MQSIQKKKIQKTSSKIRSYKLLKKKLKMMILNKSLHSFLTIFTSFRNLVDVTLQECRFNFWAKEFSTLHNLQELVLSTSTTTQSGWDGLEKTPFKSSFELIEMRNHNLLISSLDIKCSENFTKLIIYWIRDSFPHEEFGYSSPFLSFDLSCNNLGKSEKFVWEWLMQAPIRNNLQDLDLSNNYLTTLPIQIINCMKNLRTLSLRENKIKFLPKEFGTLPHLRGLCLAKNLLEKGGCSTWEWLKNSIKNNLLLLNIHCNSLTEFPLQITCMTNLRLLDISENKIKFLPKELGTLPYLKVLNLNFNYLGKCDSNAWEWLEQTAIRNKLSELYLCDNLLTELPPQVGQLNALTILYLNKNKLKCLPQTLVNLKNLKKLGLFYNNLLYLPGSIADLSMDINVNENSFCLEDNYDLTKKLEVPSLIECSAEVIVKSGLKCANVLSKVLLKYLEYEKKYCFFCQTLCFFYYGKRFIKYFEYNKIKTVQFSGTSNILNASFECYACSPQCATLLWN